MNDYIIFFKFLLTKNTLLRILQIYKCLNIKLNGLTLEFGAIKNKNKTFSNFFRGNSNFHYTNIVPNKKHKIFHSDLTKKIKSAPIVGSKINDDKIGKFIISPRVKLKE